MAPTINKKLLPVKIHYFLRFGGAAISPFLPVIVRQIGMSPDSVGFLWSCFNIVSIFTFLFISKLADTFSIHRTLFFFGLTSIFSGLFGIYYTPKFEVHGSDIANVISYENITHPTIYKEISLSITDCMTHYQFWLVLLFLIMNYCGMSIALCMGDTATFEILGEKRHKFGSQRLFGSLAVGIMGISYGAVIDYFSQNSSQRNFTSAFVLSFILLILSVIAGIFMEFKIPKKIKQVESDVWKIIGSMDVILFLTTILISGISQGSIWCFYFLYMEDVSLKWDKDFMQRNLLQGLSMAIGCFLGEVPFNHAAGFMMKKVGHIKLIAFGIAAFSVRFILYYFVTNPWYFLPIEILHGLSFGIICPVMFTYSSILSTPGTRATLQGITSAVFIGGVSLSSLVSGVLYKAIGGGKLFLYLGIMDVAFVAIVLIANTLITKKEKPSNKNNITEDDDQSRPLNDGSVAIQVVARPILYKIEMPYK